MIVAAIVLSLIAVFGGVLVFGMLDHPQGVPAWLRYGHAGAGVLALILVLASAPGESIRQSGLLVGAFMFAAAAGGALFRQRRRDGRIVTAAAAAHGALGLAAAGLLLTMWLLGLT